MASPHDALFKAVFSDPQNAVAHLRNALPAEVVEGLALEQLAQRPGSFIDEELRDRHVDLLFEVPFREREGEAFLYVVLEHQSSSDPLMPLRLLRYMLRIWDQLLVADKQRRSLPAIVPLVLHHSEAGWSAPVSFAELVEGPADVLESLVAYLPQFRFVLSDLSQTPDEELRGTALAQVAYLLLKYVRAGDFPDKLASWRDLLRTVAAEESGLRALQLVVEYVLRAGVIAVEALVELSHQVHPDMQQIVETTADRLRQEGRLEGRQEGRLEQLAEVVVRALEARGLEASDEVRSRILGSRDAAELARWFDRALVVSSVAELFDDGRDD